MKRISIITLIIILTSVLAGPALSRTTTKTDKQPIQAERQQENIKITTPQRRDFRQTIPWFGRVLCQQTVRIISRESGRIEEITAGEGLALKQGEPLLRLGGVVLRNRLHSLNEQITSLKKRRRLAERMVKFKQDSVKHQFARKDELNVAENQLSQLKLELDTVKLKQQQLKKAMFIKAPLTGIISQLRVAVGQNVNSGEELAFMVAPEKLYIKATLFSKEPAADLLNKPVTIALPNATPIPGTITRVLPTRTVAGARIVWIEGENLTAALGLGQTVNGTVILNTHKNALALPEKALVHNEKEQACIFLATADNYQRQAVKTGLSANGWTEIISGIKAGDKVVTQGAYELYYQDFSKIYKVVD